MCISIRQTSGTCFALAFVLSSSVLASAQKTTESSYNVAGETVISITNNYGPITVTPSGSRQVTVTTVSHSDAVTFEDEQRGDRIELRAFTRTPDGGLAEYKVCVPSGSWVTMRSTRGTLRAENLDGDVVLEGVSAPVEVSFIKDAHVHVKTLSGPITLTSVRSSHLDIRSVSGNILLKNIFRSSVEAGSDSGRITFEGDPGQGGRYELTSHSGDLQLTVPAVALIRVRAKSVEGELGQGVPAWDTPNGEMSLLSKPKAAGVALFVLRSFKGKIHLDRP